MKRHTLAACALLMLVACDKRPSDASASGETATAGESATTEGKAGSASLEEARRLRDSGQFERARDMYAGLAESEPGATWTGRLELASLRSDKAAASALLDAGPPDGLDDGGKRAAFVLSQPLRPDHAAVASLAKELCNEVEADAALDTACAKHALFSSGVTTKCVKGCTGEQTIGFYPAGYPIVRASINGSEPMSFGLFSAAPTSLKPATIEKLGLERTGEAFDIQSSDTTVPVRHVVADLEVGSLGWENVAFVEFDIADDFIAGAISIDDLFDRTVELDISALELRIGGQKTAGLDAVPMARLGGTYAAWGTIGEREPRPFAIAVGNGMLLLSDAYHRSGPELTVPETIQGPCDGGVPCVRSMVQDFDQKVMLTGRELDYRRVMISDAIEPRDSSLRPAAYAGAGSLRGRILRFDPSAGEFALSDVRFPALEKGDDASFSISGSRVARPATLFETVMEPGDDFVDIGQIFESEEAHEQFRIQIPQTLGERGGWLHTRRPLSTFAANPELGTKQIATEDYAKALEPYHIRYRRGPTTHIAPIDWTLGGSSQRCLELVSQAQVGPSEYGTIEFVQCPAAKWPIALFRVKQGDEVLFEMRRDEATAGDGATIQ